MGVRSLKRAVFFDRDGVMNQAIVRNGNPHPPVSLEELHVDPYARTGVSRLRSQGFSSVVITNQPDVARGTQQRAVVDAINAELKRITGVDAIYTCFHDDADGCACRKPKPGLILDACAGLGLDASRSYVVGDRVKDVLAGQAAGCTTVFVDRQYAETPAQVPADIVARSLEDAVERILQREKAAV